MCKASPLLCLYVYITHVSLPFLLHISHTHICLHPFLHLHTYMYVYVRLAPPHMHTIYCVMYV